MKTCQRKLQIIFFLFFAIFEQSLGIFLPFFIRENFHLDWAYIIFLSGVGWTLPLFFLFFGGNRIINYFSLRISIIIGLTLQIISYGLFSLEGFSSLIAWIAIVCFYLGIVILWLGIHNWLISTTKDETRGRLFANFATADALISLSFPLLIGLGLEYGWANFILYIGMLAGLILIIIAWHFRHLENHCPSGKEVLTNISKRKKYWKQPLVFFSEGIQSSTDRLWPILIVLTLGVYSFIGFFLALTNLITIIFSQIVGHAADRNIKFLTFKFAIWSRWIDIFQRVVFGFFPSLSFLYGIGVSSGVLGEVFNICWDKRMYNKFDKNKSNPMLTVVEREIFLCLGRALFFFIISFFLWNWENKALIISLGLAFGSLFAFLMYEKNNKKTLQRG